MGRAPAICSDCGATLRGGARFCGACGAPTAREVEARRVLRRAREQARARATLAVAAAFVITLAGLLVVARLAAEWPRGAACAAGLLPQVAAGFLSCALLGAGALRDSLAGPPRAVDLALALPVGALGLGVSWLWSALVSEGPPIPVRDLGPVALLAVVLGAPLVEEWLDRGVLWRALGPLTNDAGRVVGTAMLFALAHGLNGGFVLELPHRLVGGLALGWLRLRSGSLAPCVLAHVVWNGLGVLLE